jgi:hypothetical protein
MLDWIHILLFVFIAGVVLRGKTAQLLQTVVLYYKAKQVVEDMSKVQLDQKFLQEFSDL